MNTYQTNISAIEKRKLMRRERVRRRIVQLIFIIYWLMIFEGALRKWVFPGAQKFIFFIRDPFVLMVYWIAFKHKMYPRKDGMFKIGMSLVFIFMLLMLLQMLDVDFIKPIVFLFGYRMYFFYLPLAFIIAENFRSQDLRRLVKQTLFVAIPLGILAFLQFQSGPGSFWNKTVTATVYTETGAAGGRIARTTGTFTFFHGQQMYIGSIVALLFAVWILPKKYRPINGKLLYIASIAVLITFAVDITRLPIILAGFTLLAAVVSSLVIHKANIKHRAMIISGLLVVTGVVVFIGIFGAAHRARTGRFDKSYMEDRTRGMFSLGYIDKSSLPILGFGLGMTSRGAGALDPNVGKYQQGRIGNGGRIRAGENEWNRILAETGPVMGFIYILYRMLLVIYLIKGSIMATHRSGNPLPMTMAAFISPVVLFWYMTTIGTINVYGWLFAGFCMAANKLVDIWRTEDEPT